MPINSISPITLFSGENITASVYTYNSNGWEKARGDKTILQLEVATLNATSVTFRLEGRASANSRTASVCVASFTSVTNIARLIEKNDFPMHEYRLGVKINKVATPNNVYATLIKVDHVG